MIYIGAKKKQGSVVEVLKEEILSGNIPCKTEMTQNELAESLGVSRMPVREALILLEYQGLIERLPNSRVRVAVFDKDYFHEIFSMCIELENRILEAGDISGPEKPSRFEENISEEMTIHYRICRNMPNTFMRKMLHTILEIYVDFGIRCSGYDRKKGAELLKAAISASCQERRTLLEQYFSEIENVILDERKKKC